jgi:hypothetical protein
MRFGPVGYGQKKVEKNKAAEKSTNNGNFFS